MRRVIAYRRSIAEGILEPSWQEEMLLRLDKFLCRRIRGVE
jgi:hypothetical protein